MRVISLHGFTLQRGYFWECGSKAPRRHNTDTHTLLPLFLPGPEPVCYGRDPGCKNTAIRERMLHAHTLCCSPPHASAAQLLHGIQQCISSSSGRRSDVIIT